MLYQVPSCAIIFLSMLDGSSAAVSTIFHPTNTSSLTLSHNASKSLACFWLVTYHHLHVCRRRTASILTPTVIEAISKNKRTMDPFLDQKDFVQGGI